MDDCSVAKYSNVVGEGAVSKTELACLNMTRLYSSVTLHMNRWLYVVGGTDGEDYLKTAICLDLQTSQFTEAPSLNIARYQHSATVLGGCLYIIGGYGGESQLDTIEKLDIVNSGMVWNIFTTPGFTARQNAIVCTINNTQMLVAGGYYNENLLSDALIIDTAALSS